MKIVPTPDWWYHDSALELEDDYCHHGNLYEECEECALEENPVDDDEDVGWKLTTL